MPVREVPLEEVGLVNVAEAAVLKSVAVRTIQKWIADGWIPVVVAGAGKRVNYLLRRKDVVMFRPPERGRPRGGGWPLGHPKRPAVKLRGKPRGGGNKGGK